MIRRRTWELTIREALKRSRVVAMIGPRQCGKTTLARGIVSPRSVNYFDLEDHQSLHRLLEPQIALEGLRGTVVIDEVQRKPELFPLLRVLADRRPLPARFLILGSAGMDLLRQSSESLAGRIERLELSGFSLEEVGVKNMTRHWRRGGFPLSFTAPSEAKSIGWRRDFIQTFLERDLREFGITIPATALRRFWTMLAHSHGNIWNAADIARSLNISEPTARNYLDLFTGLFMVRQLQPWFENLKKRQVKAPKIYVRDSGLLHSLLSINDQRDLATHPKLGASWEGYAIEETLRYAPHDQAYFWATHQGAELDLLVFHRGKRFGIEVKYADAPHVTASMRIAMTDLGLEHIAIVYPGDKMYPLSEKVTAVPLSSLSSQRAERILFPSTKTIRRPKK